MEIVGAEDLLDILNEVSGDEEIVGALGALVPGLGAAAKKLARANAGGRGRRQIIDPGREGGRPLNTHLPMTNGSASVAAAASVALTGTPLRPFKPNGLMLMFDGVAVTLDTVTIANIPQLASNSGYVAADAFKRDAIVPYELNWDTIPQNQSLIATCTNRHGSTASAIFGTVFGKYTLS